MRKFGVEIELNCSDNKELFYISDLISKSGKFSSVSNWKYNHDNKDWVCKPDSSCGMEICSPVLDNTDEIVDIIELLSKDKNIKADERCSFHVNFNIKDCIDYGVYNSTSLTSILCWWIKCEAVFIDSFPDHRKFNRYCQFIGFLDLFDLEEKISNELVVNKLFDKYLSINTYHLLKNNRPTIEFRLAENTACTDSNFAKKWIIFLENFISKSIKKGIPDNLKWLDFFEVIEFLDIENEEIKSWFLNRISTNINSEIIFWKNFRNNNN